MRSVTFNETVTMITEHCCSCGVLFAITNELKNQLVKSHDPFYCPNGHWQRYTHETEAEKLRKELKRKEQELADQVQAKIKIANDNAKLSRDLTRLKKGVCPCCNRSFHNLHNHMKKQHPDYTK